jgi:hypothetical protein
MRRGGCLLMNCMRDLWLFVNRCKESDDFRTLPKHLCQITKKQNAKAQHNKYIIANIPTFIPPECKSQNNIQLGSCSLESLFKSWTSGFNIRSLHLLYFLKKFLDFVSPSKQMFMLRTSNGSNQLHSTNKVTKELFYIIQRHVRM